MSVGSKSLGIRATLVLWACLSGPLALQWLVDLGMVGFPDGYITPYARATGTLLHVLVWACLAQSLYFACRALFGKRFEPSLFLQILVAVALTVVPVLIVKKCPRSQTCSNIYEKLTNTMMDDGAGG